MINADQLRHDLDQAGQDWADKKAAFNALDRITKPVLADILVGFMDSGLSRTESESRALSSSAYKGHLACVAVAEKAFLQAQVLWNNLQTYAELLRSEESTRRAEMAMR